MAERISSQTTVWRNVIRRVRKANPTVDSDQNLLRPAPPATFFWINKNLPAEHLSFGNAVVVEHRYIADVGLVVRSWIGNARSAESISSTLAAWPVIALCAKP